MIGFDSGTNTQYECIRFPDHNLNRIRTTVNNSNVRTISIRAAKDKVNARLDKLKSRKSSLKDLLRTANTQKRALQKGFLGTAAQIEKLQQLTQRIETLSAKISDVTVQQNILRELLKDIDDCRKPGEPRINGTVQFLSGFYDNGTRFYVVVAYVFDQPAQLSQRYCGRVVGNNVTRPGWSQVLHNGPPFLAKLTPTVSPCLGVNVECINPRTQIAFGIATTAGIQAPGSCSGAVYCSLDQALADAQLFFGGISITDVEPFTNQTNCF